MPQLSNSFSYFVIGENINLDKTRFPGQIQSRFWWILTRTGYVVMSIKIVPLLVSSLNNDKSATSRKCILLHRYLSQITIHGSITHKKMKVVYEFWQWFSKFSTITRDSTVKMCWLKCQWSSKSWIS